MKILANPSSFVAARSWSWQQHLKGAIRQVDALLAAVELVAETAPHDGPRPDVAAHDRFETFVPWPYLSRIKKGNWQDPLLRQVLPVASELSAFDGYTADPNQERSAFRAPGVLQKYPSRVLLVAARSCAINCRYCFRREFPYDSAPVSREAWSESLASVRNDSSIREVILSGGEPLINADATLAWFMEELQAIGHVERLRIHTRLPVVIPQRVTEELVRLLPSSRLRTTVVLHTNHANEVDAEVADAMGRLRSVPNLILLNQSVLLAGVNDSVDALETLSWRLLDCGAVPYYLHQLDRVQGAGHFEVPLDRGRQLITALERKLPGYALPRWVREEPGLPHKQTLFP